MENAADALKMAAAVLIFVLAVSIIIFYFGQARQTSDIIIDYRDRETTYSSYEPNTSGVRTVSFETVVPSIFRSYLENYKIIFDGLNSPIYKIKRADGQIIEKYTLDLETSSTNIYTNVVLANNSKKAEFIKGILYGDFKTNKNDFEKDFKISLDGCESIYDQLKRNDNRGISRCILSKRF